MNWVSELRNLTLEQTIKFWHEAEQTYGLDAIRQLCINDRYYLLVRVCNRADALHPWLFDRCREVEAAPDDHLDLWAREHFKSTIITFAGCIQEIIRDPEITIGIFSHSRGIAVKFLRQIKEELEGNDRLKQIFPEIFFANPAKEAPRWALESGIVVKRQSNPKEATIEAWGLVDGQPTSAHFKLRVYDDVVTRESVNTPEQIKKTTDAWALSDNLSAAQPDGSPGRRWHIGTRYHLADTYHDILERKVLTPRIYPATDDGTLVGTPVLFTQQAWDEKKQTQGEASIACQMLQNPASGTQAMFKKEWLKFTDIRPTTLNIYIMADPASSKKRGSDKTAIAVVAIDAQNNKYLIDGYHHKMSLQERWTALSSLRKHWRSQPGVQHVYVGYERYGMRSDLEYFEERMLLTKDSFEIRELAWPGDGTSSKIDRVQRLEPDFRNGRFYLIKEVDGQTSNQTKIIEQGQSFRVLKPVKRRDHEGNIYNLNQNFITEYLFYPFSLHDDFLDATSRIYDMDANPPIIIDQRSLEPEVYVDGI